MNANPVPLQLQLPAKYFSSFSFGFGPGGASAARSWAAAKARAITKNVALFIEFSPFESSSLPLSTASLQVPRNDAGVGKNAACFGDTLSRRRETVGSVLPSAPAGAASTRTI